MKFFRKNKKSKIKNSINYVQNRLWYMSVITILALASGAMLIYEFYGPDLSESAYNFFQNMDLTIAYIFLTDFIFGMYASNQGLSYIQKNFLDFLGSIPLTDNLFRIMRIFRFTRLVRILRAVNTSLNIQDGVKRLHNRHKFWQKFLFWRR